VSAAARSPCSFLTPMSQWFMGSRVD
jgi:hypothetical protein